MLLNLSSFIYSKDENRNDKPVKYLQIILARTSDSKVIVEHSKSPRKNDLIKQ